MRSIPSCCFVLFVCFPPCSCNENTFTLEYLASLGSQSASVAVGAAKVELIDDAMEVDQSEEEEEKEEKATHTASDIKKEKEAIASATKTAATKKSQKAKK